DAALGFATPEEVGSMKAQTRSAANTRAAGAASPHVPSGQGRVAIEAVHPEIDGGRAAAKRIVGETVVVEADIFTDGHDKIAADVLFRTEDAHAWRRAPMQLRENDRWGGRFRVDQ